MDLESLRDFENQASREISFELPMGVNLFLAGTEGAVSLPSEIVNHPILVEQAAQRRELVGQVDNIFAKIPDVHMDVEEAMALGIVGEEEVVGFFQGLNDFIET